jgi:acyl-CoA synthetase (AMP-forming)/AMP-acid ligase II
MSPRTFLDVLDARADAAPDALLYRFLRDGEVDGDQRAWTVAETVRRSHAVARALGDRQHGDRVLLLFPPCLDFIAALLGAMRAGVVAVPVAPPDPRRPLAGLARLQAVAADAGVSQVLTVSSGLAMRELAVAGAPALADVPWLAVDDLPAGGDAVHRPHPLAVLQYTSGSTGAPKGVRVRHTALLANMDLGQRSWRTGPDTPFVSWLPMFHDMGLVAKVLHVVCCDTHTTFLSPLHFLQRPARWLEALDRFGGVGSIAPDFAYNLAIRKTTPEARAALDLSRWTLAGCGAEPVRATTLRRFAEAFADSGFSSSSFYPMYGLAEATLGVSCTQRGGPGWRSLHLDAAALARGRVVAGDDVEVVSCGRFDVVDQDVRTVRDGAPCEPGMVGEIWVRGDSVAEGYWGRTDPDVFDARLDGLGPYLRTGDLGFVDDGELFVVGRDKDLLIVGGRNLHPQDLEDAVLTAHPAVRPGCAALAQADDGRVYAFVEVDPRRPADGLVDAVSATLFPLVRAPVTLVTLAPHALLKTSSGKLRRQPTLRAHLAGALQGVQAQAHTVGEVSDVVRDALATELGRAPDPGETFAAMGLDSSGVVAVAEALSTALGRPVHGADLYDHPTPAKLTAFLDGGVTEVHRPVTRSRAVAIVGAACRLPGGIDDLDGLARLLAGGADPITEVPAARWDLDAWYDPTPGTPGRMCTRHGGFLDDLDRFDAPFFGLTDRAADALDPQQRLLLEVTWEALERAGVDPTALDGHATAIVVGAGPSEYAQRTVYGGAVDPWSVTGAHAAVAAGRLAHTLGTRGPAWSLDTACSSSLLAVHQAAELVARGEVDRAVAGGVNVVLTPPGHGLLLADRCHVPQRPVPHLLGLGRRLRPRRGLRHGRARAPRRGTGRRQADPRRPPWERRQPRRHDERPHSPQRHRPGGRDPGRARPRGAHPRGGGPRRDPRHRHPARGRRGAGRAGPRLRRT